MEKIQKPPKVLLLGAGFSANFNAPVSTEIWNILYNHPYIQQRNELRSRLVKYRINGNFEGFYHELVLNKEKFSLETKKITDIIYEIYEWINKSEQVFIKNNFIDEMSILNFLESFSRKKNGKGLIFTLNQDLLLEWLINGYKPKEKNILWGLNKLKYLGPIQVPRFIQKCGINHFEKNVILPINGFLEWHKNNKIDNEQPFPLYVKLHGSFGWQAKETAMIIGGNKFPRLLQYGILKYYYETFATTLDDKLDIWVVGYSFNDIHINQIIFNSINLHDSSLYIIDIKPINSFFDILKKNNKQLYEAIEKNLRGYFPYGLLEIFSNTIYKAQLDELLLRY